MTVSKQKVRRHDAAPLPTALPAIQPLVAGIDIGSSQHLVCGPARENGTPNTSGSLGRRRASSTSSPTG
jgi:hypothetical protein